MTQSNRRLIQQHLDQAKKQHEGKHYAIRDGGITCYLCGMTSYNRDDIREHYCGHCHLFLDKVSREDAAHQHKPHITMWVPRRRRPLHKSRWFWLAVGVLVIGVACLVVW